MTPAAIATTTGAHGGAVNLGPLFTLVEPPDWHVGVARPAGAANYGRPAPATPVPSAGHPVHCSAWVSRSPASFISANPVRHGAVLAVGAKGLGTSPTPRLTEG